MPAYWFLYNMYALERNAWKYIDRDKRQERVQHLEYDYLAPDTINELVNAIRLLQQFTGAAYLAQQGQEVTASNAVSVGKKLLDEQNEIVDELEVVAEGFENTRRKTLVTKVQQAYNVYQQLIKLYAVNQLLESNTKAKSSRDVFASIPSRLQLNKWLNIGGQLIPADEVEKLKKSIKKGQMETWDDVHDFYQAQADIYPQQKLAHALAALKEVTGIRIRENELSRLIQLLDDALATRTWMSDGIYNSRAKDYSNPYRQMVYETEKEMEAVIGSLEDNSFLTMQKEQLSLFTSKIKKLKKTLRK